MASTSTEQMFLELINSARLDPLGDAARYITSYSTLHSDHDLIDDALHFDFPAGPGLPGDGVTVDGEELLAQFTALTPVQPLAWNENLKVAAREHSDKMIEHGEQSHQLPDEGTLFERTTAANYTSPTLLGENIYAFAEDALYGHAGFMVDWGHDTLEDDDDGIADGIQDPAGHRDNIMDPLFREVGIGVKVHDPANVDDVGPLVITQDFGARNNDPAVFILGVAYDDNVVVDDFYSINEGVSGLAVSVGGGSAVTTGSSGGYVVGSNLLGMQTISLTREADEEHPTIDISIVTVLADLLNIKLDVVDSSTLLTSASGTISGATTVRGLGLTGLTLTTGSGSQTIVGTKGSDTLAGGSDNDTLVGGSGNDTLNGGSESDTASYAGAAAAVSVDLAVTIAQNTGGAGTDTLAAIENLTGSSHNDTLTGDAGANTLNGGNGNDTITGGAESDTLVGGSGNDSLDGGSELDTASYAGAASAVTVSLATLDAQNTAGAGTDTLAFIENLTGSSHNDVLTGTGEANTLNGGSGNDTLNGDLGDDTLNGSSGNDILNGSSGNDTLNGSSGNDTLNGSAGNDTMAGGSGNDTYVVDKSSDIVTEVSSAGTDTVQSKISYTLETNLEHLTLTGSSDRSGTGNSRVNTIQGNSGDNLLDGKGGADTVKGGSGADTLIYSSSDVLLDGGSGNSDVLKLTSSGTHLNLTTLANGKIVGIERIDLSSSGGQKVTLNLSEVLDLSSTTNTLRVMGGSSDTLARGSGWTHGADQVISGQSYETYTQGLATLLVDSDITSVV